MRGPVVGFDYGDRHIGIAVGQPLTGSATPLKRLRRPRNEADWRAIDAVFEDWQPVALVVGLPLNMDTTEQPVTARARNFAAELETRYGLRAALHDERLSTREARERVREQGGDPARNDAQAAAVIVEGWLASAAALSDSLRRTRE